MLEEKSSDKVSFRHTTHTITEQGNTGKPPNRTGSTLFKRKLGEKLEL